MQRYRSECHCGNIRLIFSSMKKAHEFSVRSCDCSFCTAHQARYISDPDGEVQIEIGKRQCTNYYRFGHETADFIICQSCGAYLVAVCKHEQAYLSVLNISWFRAYAEFNQLEHVGHLQEESVGLRNQRRARTWTPTTFGKLE